MVNCSNIIQFIVVTGPATTLRFLELTPSPIRGPDLMSSSQNPEKSIAGWFFFFFFFLVSLS